MLLRLRAIPQLGELGGDGETRRTDRQKAETVMSVATRREALSTRLDATRETPALLRGVINDLNRLVRLDHAA